MDGDEPLETQGPSSDFACGTTNKSYHATIFHMWGSWNAFLVTRQEPQFRQQHLATAKGLGGVMDII